MTNLELSQALKNRQFNTIRISQVKNGSNWETTETQHLTFTDEQKQRFISKDTLLWFSNLGGIEKVEQGTYKGYGATINTSVSPDRTERKITYFLF